MNTKAICHILILVYLGLSMKTSAQDALSANVTNPTYNKSCKNGEIDLMINAGFPPYEVVWKRISFNGTQVVQTNTDVQGNDDGEDLQNVFAATYLVEVTDALCGIAKKTFKIKCVCSYDCTVEGQVTHPTCDEEGAIIVNMNCQETGHSPFTYKWSDGPSLKDRTNLSAGTYCVTVSDKNACTFENCFTVEMGDNLQVIIADKQNVSNCSTGPNGSNCNGSINIEVINGNGPYQYKWSNGAHTQDLTNLCQGSYSLTVTDNLNCKQSLSTQICCCNSSNTTGIEDCYGNQSNPPPLMIQGEAQGFPNPNIITQISGGTGDYSCSWTGPNGYNAYSCLGIGNMTEVGTYCITVNDGCNEAMKCFDIIDCSQANITASANILHTCDELTVGEVSLTITGGTPPYEVSWNNSQYTGQTIQNLDEGQYCAYVRDANGCIKGPFCFYVGSQPGEVSLSTIPCARTIKCNGIDYTDYYEYEVSWDCNTRYSYCPATQETTVEEFGWANLYVEFCNLWGVCQDGQTLLLSVGEPIFEPLLVFEENCQYNQGCVNSYCKFNGQIVLDDAVPSYCSLIADYHQNYSLCGSNCAAKVYCSGTLMNTICTEIPCIFAINDKNTTSFSTNQNYSSSTIMTTSQWIEMIKTGQTSLDLESIHQKSGSTSSLNTVSIFPNPTNGLLNISFSSSKNEIIYYRIINPFGELITTNHLSAIKGMNNFELDISSYIPGVYFIQITRSNNNTTIHKIIKS